MCLAGEQSPFLKDIDKVNTCSADAALLPAHTQAAESPRCAGMCSGHCHPLKHDLGMHDRCSYRLWFVCCSANLVLFMARHDVAYVWPQDILHTFGNHPWLQEADGQAALRRVLAAYSMHNPDVGYCRSMNNIVALLLVALNRYGLFVGRAVGYAVQPLCLKHCRRQPMALQHVSRHSSKATV